MSDDEVDYELLELLRQSLGIKDKPKDEISSDTGVLKDAEFIYNNAIDVSIDMCGTKSAALMIWKTIQQRGYSMQAWSEHELHPKLGEDFNEVEMANFVFTMDLLNFSFWSELSQQERFQVEFKGKRWTGYMSLIACLRRALDEGTPITTPLFWRSSLCTDETIKYVFRSATDEQMPLLEERILILREAGDVLEDFDNSQMDACSKDTFSKEAGGVEDEQPTSDVQDAHLSDASASTTAPELDGMQPTLDTEAHLFAASASTTAPGLDTIPTNDATAKVDHAEAMSGADTIADTTSASAESPDLSMFHSGADRSVVNLISKADKSAGKLVNFLVKYFSSFRDECRFEGRKVRLLKRAQILVADLHAACNGQGVGEFSDIDNLTMFADYRVPQILHRFGVLSYCPPLEGKIQRHVPLEHRSSWEVQIRGCAIWATELLRREIRRQPGTESVNAVLIDFMLYDLAKELEAKDPTPHHRTRSINY